MLNYYHSSGQQKPDKRNPWIRCLTAIARPQKRALKPGQTYRKSWDISSARLNFHTELGESADLGDNFLESEPRETSNVNTTHMQANINSTRSLF